MYIDSDESDIELHPLKAVVLFPELHRKNSTSTDQSRQPDNLELVGMNYI